MLTNLSRIIKFGLQRFWRNASLSTATIAIMFLALIVFGGINLFNVISRTTLTSIQDKIDISVFFKSTTPEDEILKIQSTLKAMPEVKNTEYISRDKALEIFKEQHQGDETITQAIDQAGENPLLASISIKAQDPKQYQMIASFLGGDEFKNSVEKVSYDERNSQMIDRLIKIIDTTRLFGLLVTIFLTLIAVLVTLAAIGLAIHSSRDEIGIMRLVGASNFFTSGPYIVEGITYGLISAILSMIILFPIVYFGSPYVKVFVPEMNLKQYFDSHFFLILLQQILFGIVVGVTSSVIAVRKYLKI
ncbi:MAG: permease-like cell division protein FtsX [Candidatus Paceibacterota bacterium]|jgi:cell division transport system permease protein